MKFTDLGKVNDAAGLRGDCQVALEALRGRADEMFGIEIYLPDGSTQLASLNLPKAYVRGALLTAKSDADQELERLGVDTSK